MAKDFGVKKRFAQRRSYASHTLLKEIKQVTVGIGIHIKLIASSAARATLEDGCGKFHPFGYDLVAFLGG